jgi:hypothetical protein
LGDKFHWRTYHWRAASGTGENKQKKHWQETVQIPRRTEFERRILLLHPQFHGFEYNGAQEDGQDGLSQHG